MRILASIPAILLLSGTLAACSTNAAPQGVLPRTPVPPPPSVTGNNKATSARQTAAETRRRSIDVPDRLDTPSPAAPASSPAIEPVMTGRGVGAGFRF
ncbi:hypothetical protein [Microvirga puerhi]|uniref:Lipoprotein n=1 Tax=Microvirga puerhi TaxID=2876078 RepID=A0ABS7VI92_9HYPH|nr:hypothetical protein [Microvirga puerhi]MBZ6074693.1 hypothetical protein [Microvirga puerhi]